MAIVVMQQTVQGPFNRPHGNILRRGQVASKGHEPHVIQVGRKHVHTIRAHPGEIDTGHFDNFQAWHLAEYVRFRSLFPSQRRDIEEQHKSSKKRSIY